MHAKHLGDFRQCLPVIPKATHPQIIESLLCKTPWWSEVQILRLHTNMRVLTAILDGSSVDDTHIDALRFSEWLLRIGSGLETSPEESVEIPIRTIPNISL